MEDFFEIKFVLASDTWHSCHLCGDAIPPGMSYWEENSPEEDAEIGKNYVCRRCYRLYNEMMQMML